MIREEMKVGEDGRRESGDMMDQGACEGFGKLGAFAWNAYRHFRIVTEVHLILALGNEKSGGNHRTPFQACMPFPIPFSTRHGIGSKNASKQMCVKTINFTPPLLTNVATDYANRSSETAA